MGNSSSGLSWPRDVRDLFRGGNARPSRRRRGDVAGHHNDRHYGPSGVDERVVLAADTGRAGTTPRGAGSGRSNYNKLDSCPDLQMAARTGIADQQRRQRNDADQPPLKLNVKVYRSYRFRSTAVVLKEHVAAKHLLRHEFPTCPLVVPIKLRLSWRS